MDSVQEQVEALLKENKAELVRTRKHRVWRFPNGRIFTTATSPSDSHAWNNSLRELHRILGIRPAVKTHADFEHQQKEEYAKPVEHKKEFLASLPEREARPQTPISESPLVHLKRKLEKEAEEKAAAERKLADEALLGKEKEVFTIGGKAPTVGHRGYRERSGRSGPVTQYSPTKIAELNLIMNARGADALKQFLDAKREVPTQSQKEEKQSDKEEGMTLEVHEHSGGFSLDTAIKDANAAMAKYAGEIKKHEGAIEALRVEVSRYQQIIESLERTAKLASASRTSLKDLLPSNGNVVDRKSTGTHNPKGFWRDRAKEILVTTPISLTKPRFVDELMRVVPDTSRGNAQQVMYRGIREGDIIIDARGFCRWKEEKNENAG